MNAGDPLSFQERWDVCLLLAGSFAFYIASGNIDSCLQQRKLQILQKGDKFALLGTSDDEESGLVKIREGDKDTVQEESRDRDVSQSINQSSLSN
ncbi:hypothetical protein QQF64_008452 [Cirrhinus molitorella]|uniref:Uncharacterized protein n=1 Tax=Cirrhinus molitorella TaxID=172907 RepID=A0ABR3M702_9TELE